MDEIANDRPLSNYLLTAITMSAAVLLIALSHFSPSLGVDEATRLVGGKQFIDTAFLANDWFYGTSDATSFAYDFVTAPFWLLSSDPTTIAILLRVIIWTLLTVALVELSVTLGLHPFAAALGVLLWFSLGQSTFSDSWIFGDAKAKGISYALVFFSLSAILKRRYLFGGILIGLAFAFHPVVGGWAGIALSVAVIVELSGDTVEKHHAMKSYFIAAGSIALPFFFFFLFHLSSSMSSEMASQADSIYVYFRNPHHLDSSQFPFNAIVWHFMFLLIALGLIFQQATSEARTILATFLLGLQFVLLAGFIAESTQAAWFLKSYPFRLATAITPLLCLMLIASSLLHGWSSKRQQQLVWGAMVFVVAYLMIKQNSVGFYLNKIHMNSTAWMSSESSPVEDEALFSWVRQNIPVDAVVLVPPWKTWYLKMDRAQVVSFKAVVPSVKMIEWKERLQWANRKEEFKGKGFEVLEELKTNYPRLPVEQLKLIRKLYSAQYYIVPTARFDLAHDKLYQNKSWYVYAIEAESKDEPS